MSRMRPSLSLPVIASTAVRESNGLRRFEAKSIGSDSAWYMSCGMVRTE